MGRPPTLGRGDRKDCSAKPSTTGAHWRRMVIPEFETLRKLRDALARGGLRALGERTPEDHARIAEFETIASLLRFLEEFKRRVEAGERCRLLQVKRRHDPGRLSIEIAIEAQP